MKITFDCYHPEELEEAAEILINFFRTARVFTFSGDLGAGKTTFIKAVCHELGSPDPVSSPTYSLVNEYRLDDDKKIYHFDFYRITDPSEALDIGFEEYLESGNYCLIEWPKLISDLLPPETVNVQIREKESARQIIMTGTKEPLAV